MEQSFDIKNELKTILALCQKANHCGTQEERYADEAFWTAILILDRRASVGMVVSVGRLVRLPAKDSYAYYVVSRVTKKSVKLIHIPYGQAYESPCVIDDEADFNLIEKTLEWYGTINLIFRQMENRLPVGGQFGDLLNLFDHLAD